MNQDIMIIGIIMNTLGGVLILFPLVCSKNRDIIDNSITRVGGASTEENARLPNAQFSLKQKRFAIFGLVLYIFGALLQIYSIFNSPS